MNKYILTLFSMLISLSTHAFAIWPTKGEGPQVERKFSIEKFSKLLIDGPYMVIIDDVDSNQILIKGEENMLDRTEIKQVNDSLVLRETTWISPQKPIVVRVGSKSIDILKVKGESSVRLSKTSSKDFALELMGSGSVQGNIENANQVSIKNMGSGHIELSGMTQKVNLSTSGSGNNSLKMKGVLNANISGNGSSTTYLQESKSVEVKLTGSSSLVFSGPPSSVKSNTVGSSKVIFQ